MQITSTPVTADKLWSLPPDGYRYELMRGNLRTISPALGRHGRIEFQLAWILNSHVGPNKLGVVLAAETGFKIDSDPDTVLAPDVAFVSQQRYDELADDTGYIPFAPDLAIEVLSPTDRFSRVETKAVAWLDAGCKIVLVVDPESETIRAYWSRQKIQIFEKPEVINCHAAVPNWQLPVAQVFKR